MIQPITIPAAGTVEELRQSLINTLNKLIVAINAEANSQTSKLDMGNNRLTNLAQPVAPTDAATKGYVDKFVAGAVLKTTGTR